MIRIHDNVAVATLAAAAFLFQACVNSPDDIERVAGVMEMKPITSQKNVRYEYSDSARIILIVNSPMAQDYSNAEAPYHEFPEGIDVTFFDKFGNQESYLRSNYAKRLLKDQMWVARGDVQVINTSGEQLFTEHLVWEMEKEIIRSDEFVKIISGDEVIMGEGFEADQNFNTYKIFRRVSGQILIPETKTEEEND